MSGPQRSAQRRKKRKEVKESEANRERKRRIEQERGKRQERMRRIRSIVVSHLEKAMQGETVTAVVIDDVDGEMHSEKLEIHGFSSEFAQSFEREEEVMRESTEKERTEMGRKTVDKGYPPVMRAKRDDQGGVGVIRMMEPPDPLDGGSDFQSQSQGGMGEGYGVEVEDMLENIQIYSSINYQKFSLILTNRPVDMDRVNKMVHMIKKGYNYFRYFPALVSPDWEIIDGQHRHAAAQITGSKFHYMLAADIHMEDAARAVSVTKSWNMKNYLESYAKRGFPDYVALENFWKINYWLPISSLISICSSGKYTPGSFNNGHYRIDRLPFAQKTVNLALSFREAFPQGYKSPSFLHTMSSLASNPLYQHKRMVEKMRTQGTRLVRCATVEQYLELLSEIYNWRVPAENRVYFIESYRRRKVGTTNPQMGSPKDGGSD